jgi:hypothetical protein
MSVGKGVSRNQGSKKRRNLVGIVPKRKGRMSERRKMEEEEQRKTAE